MSAAVSGATSDAMDEDKTADAAAEAAEVKGDDREEAEAEAADSKTIADRVQLKKWNSVALWSWGTHTFTFFGSALPGCLFSFRFPPLHLLGCSPVTR